MRKKRVLMLGTAFLLCAGLMIGGCGKQEAPVKEQAEEEESEPEEEKEEEEILPVIGTEAEGENIYKVTLENKTGKNIVGFSVKDSTMSEYPANMLAEGEVFAADERRNLYYDSASTQTTEPTEIPEASEAESPETPETTETAEDGADEKILEPQIDVQLTFEDQTVMVLSAFPFGDIEEGGICLEDEVAFIQYESVENKESVSTKEAELTIKAQAEAEAAATAEAQRQAEEAAAAEAQRQAEEAAAAAAAEAQRQAEAAAAAQRQQQQKQQQKPQQSSGGSGNSGSSGGGCVNDGLVY